jgi:hypothetical protein
MRTVTAAYLATGQHVSPSRSRRTRRFLRLPGTYRSSVNQPIAARRGRSAVGPVTGLAGRLDRGRIGDHGLVTEGGAGLSTAKKPAFELRSRGIYRNLTHRSGPRNVLLVREGTGCREAAPTLRRRLPLDFLSGPRSGSR